MASTGVITKTLPNFLPAQRLPKLGAETRNEPYSKPL